MISMSIEDKICGPPKDSDICLEDETNGEWKGWKCSDASSYCYDSWIKDIHRCCPETCALPKPFTESDCNSASGSGTCIYPNDAQCPVPTPPLTIGKI